MSIWEKFGLDEQAITEAKEEMDFKPLPEGEYEVVVANTTITETKSGRPMLEMEYTVIGKGRTLYMRQILDHAVSQKIIYQTMLALGFTEEQFRNLNSFEQAHGKKGLAVVKIETSEYNGETRHNNVIKRIKPLANASTAGVTTASSKPAKTAPKQIADPATATTTEDAPF